VGQGREMTKKMYSHVNKWIIKINKINKISPYQLHHFTFQLNVLKKFSEVWFWPFLWTKEVLKQCLVELFIFIIFWLCVRVNTGSLELKKEWLNPL
jgi:hypothetical protein